MKTEMQQLEENTKIQKAKETVEEVTKYMESLTVKMGVLHTEYNKHTTWELIASVGWIATIPFSGVLGEWLFVLGWFVWFMMYVRGRTKETALYRTFSEFDGAIETLHILGYISKIDMTKGKKKKKLPQPSLYKRFKEMFERVGSGKEAYGT